MMGNEREDFVEIYLKYQNLIYKVAYDHIHNYDTAQDICQETFLRLYTYFEYMPKEKIKYWMITVAANYAKDMLKKGGKYTELIGLPELDTLVGMMPATNDVDDYMKRAECRELFSTAMTKLREKNEMWYEILVLAECMEVPRKKIAEVYGIALTTVDGYLKRAKEWLRANFGEDYYDI